MNVALLVTLLAVALSTLAEESLYGRRPGAAWVLFFAALVLSALLLARRLERKTQLWTWGLWFVPAAAAVAMTLYDANLVATWGPVLLCCGVVGCYYWTFSGPVGLDSFRRPLPMPVWVSAVGWPLEVLPGWRALRIDRMPDGATRRIALGVLASIPALLLFGSLFAMSDDVFRDLLRRLSAHLGDGVLMPLVRISLLSCVLLGMLRLLVLRSRLHEDVAVVPRQEDPLILGMVLGSLNLLFLSFLVVQGHYLFGGEALIQLPGITYAEYARKGFFELSAVAALVLVLVWAFYRALQSQAANAVPLGMCQTLILQTFAVAASAAKRMTMYTSAYGLTVLRFYVLVAMVGMCILLLLVLVAIVCRRPGGWLAARIFYVGWLLVGGTALINVEGTVAWTNVLRANATQVDMDYLGSLSADAAPALEEAWRHCDHEASTQRASQAFRALKARTQTDPWQSFNLSRDWLTGYEYPHG